MKTRRQDAREASLGRQDARQTEKQASTATAAAARAGTQAANATSAAEKALQLATPPFGGTPYGQPLALPAGCTLSCTSPQPLTAQPFPAQTFYVTDLVLGNTASGEGTLTLTLGGKPVLIEPLGNTGGTDLKPSTPLLVRGDESLALKVSCERGPCAPSVFVSGLAPAKPPDPSGPNGTPDFTRLSRSCQPISECSVMTVPAKAKSYELTDVVFQNPAGDTGTVTLTRGGQPLLVEGLDKSRPGSLPISFASPLVLKAGEKLTLTVDCRNTSGKKCTPGALLLGVLRLVP
jgi:hypothetical protein